MSASLALLSFLLCLGPTRQTDAAQRGGRFDLGLDAGYGVTSRAATDLPEKVHGATVGLGLRYELDDAWFLGLDARLDFHQPYRIVWPASADSTAPTADSTAPTPDEEPAPEPAEQGPVIERFFLSSLALGVGYNIDVYKIVPYMGLWLVGLRVDQLATIQNASGDAFTKAQVDQLGYDIGGRVSLGVDYDITPHVTIGAALAYDWFFTAATAYANRLLLFARAAYRFGTPRAR